MDDHNEENRPPNPNDSEKSRFGIAPELSFLQKEGSGSHATDAHSPTLTRFGMIPPTLFQPAKTGMLRFREDSDTADSMPEMSEQSEPLSHSSGRERQRFFATLSHILFRSLQAVVFLFLLMTMLGLGAYVVFHDSIYPSAPGQSQTNIGVETPPTSVRFFDLTQAARRFVFLVDATQSMGASESPGFLFVTNQLRRSLRQLQEFDNYGVLFFNSQLIPLHTEDGNWQLVPADSANLSKSLENISRVQPEGICDLKIMILSAINAKPDKPEAIFLACNTNTGESLTVAVQEELKTAIGGIKFAIVEIADAIKPLNETPLEKFAANLGADYQWLNLHEKTVQNDEILLAKKEIYENASILPLTDIIDEDFKFIDDVSREETRRLSPFGREPVVGPDHSLAGVDALTEPPKQLTLLNNAIREIETDARIVYMSGFAGMPQSPRSPQMLRVGAESRLSLWVRGAKAELPAAEYLIGLCYKNGVRVKMDDQKAFQCELRAASQGCLPAMHYVAAEYKIRSESIPPDPKALVHAKYWTEKAARLGEPLSQCLWANHFTTTADERFLWLEKAAEQNLPEAQYLLGKCFESGNGTRANQTQAMILYEKSAKQGFAAAQMALEKIQAQTQPNP